MPIYEYRCKACEHETEALQKMSDRPLRKCPECGRMQLQRLISAPSFRLKGDGWYETDFKSDKENKRNIHGEKSESSDKSADSKKDSKQDKKSGKEAAGSGKKESSSPGKSGGKGSSSAVA